MSDDLLPVILKWLDAGGNVAVILLLIVAWKFDRRLLRIEIELYNGMKTRIEKIEKWVDHLYSKCRASDVGRR